ncbi:MAG: HPr family phosphocarrier protein [Victivallaceae bacterium]|nr:HPr family phosphocarrier protein [Victivallaceae bacterium]
MKERSVTIKNRAGIHCRPASAILTVIMNEFPGHTFIVTTGDGECELTSILNLISLGLQCGAKATLKVDGPNEDVAIVKIGDLFEYEFDFPPRG